MDNNVNSIFTPKLNAWTRHWVQQPAELMCILTNVGPPDTDQRPNTNQI
jgi:hypothetical protein